LEVIIEEKGLFWLGGEEMSVYDFIVKTASGEEKSLQDYEGQVLLIVNTASKCGFTPQYEGLQKLYEKYRDRGLVVLGFPCNQFGGQEPDTDEEIQSFCQVNYGVTFPVFAKIEVNGKHAHPLYQYLKKEASGVLGDAIKWNFTKFLVDRQGKVQGRFAPTTKPAELEKEIEKYL
jgi:glutathione peroxidase